MKRTKVIVSTVFTILFLVLLGLHLKQNDWQVDVLDAGLLFLAFVACGWTVAESLKVPGIGEVTYLKGEVQRQKGEIRALQFVVAHFLPDEEIRVMNRFIASEPYPMDSQEAQEFFRASGNLRALKFIEPIRENWDDEFREGHKDLKTLFTLSDRGREYLELRKKSESFKP